MSAEARRFLADASTLIALAACGRLDLLRAITGTVVTTPAVVREAASDRPGGEAVRQAIADGWIRVVEATGEAPGLGAGEASILAAASAADVVILDDRAARLEARSRGIHVTGLLGLLVHGVTTERITRAEAHATVDALAHGDFRMSAELYLWAR